MGNYKIIPIELRDANKFIEENHRHNKRVAGHRFSIGLERDGEVIGVGIVGRPVARMLDDGKTVEVLRVCVKEGYKNANSKIYGRLKRIVGLLGYKSMITYTLTKECQSSLKALGAHIVAEVSPQSWDRKKRKREERDVYKEKKYRWELNPKEVSLASSHT